VSTIAGTGVVREPTDEEREWLKRALALWVILAIGVAIKCLVQPSSHTVFPVFAVGARSWWADISLYVRCVEQDLFRYSPTFAVAMTPFGLLPHWAGGVLWGIASTALLVWTVRVFLREILPGDWPPQREALLLTLVLIGSARGIWSGQSNALLISLAMWACVAIARRQWWLAAFLLAGPVFMKLWPIALALLLMACWPRQLIGRFCAAAGVLAAVPFLTRPFATVCWQYSGWFAMLRSTQQERWHGYRDAWTIWEYLQTPVPYNVYEMLQVETGLAVLAWCLWQRQALGPTRRLLASVFSIWVGWQLFLGPGSERLTYLIVAPTMAWVLLTSLAEKRLRVLAVAAWLLATLLSMGAFERLLLPIIPFAPALLPLGVAVYLAWVVLHETAARDEPQLERGDCDRGVLAPAALLPAAPRHPSAATSG
jgi:hypothetical protein